MKVVVVTNEMQGPPLFRKLVFLARKFAKELSAFSPGFPTKESHTSSSERLMPLVKNSANPDPAGRWHHAHIPGSKYGPDHKFN